MESPELPDEGLGFTFLPEFRAFSEGALRAVHVHNAFLLDELAQAPHVLKEEQLRSTNELAAALTTLSAAERMRLAACPVCLVDGGFLSSERWRAGLSEFNVMQTEASESAILGRPQAIQLARETVTLAWTLAQSSPDGAAIVFGMDRQFARTFAASSICALQQIAECHLGWFRPRWGAELPTWNTFIQTAQRGPQAHLPSLPLRILQRQLADLLAATCESLAKRRICR